jgi:hypothetical protein
MWHVGLCSFLNHGLISTYLVLPPGLPSHPDHQTGQQATPPLQDGNTAVV